MADPNSALGGLGIIGAGGNAPFNVGGFSFDNIPNTLETITHGVSTIGQIDMMGLITIGLALLMFFVALAGMMEQMSRRNRRDR